MAKKPATKKSVMPMKDKMMAVEKEMPFNKVKEKAAKMMLKKKV